MIIDQPLQMMIKGVQARGSEYAGLAPATAEPLAQHPGTRDVLRASSPARSRPGLRGLWRSTR